MERQQILLLADWMTHIDGKCLLPDCLAVFVSLVRVDVPVPRKPPPQHGRRNFPFAVMTKPKWDVRNTNFIEWTIAGAAMDFAIMPLNAYYC